ncbi:S1C family serine protease [Salisediminibacterium halotolerans]|uniref:Serine protease Do n=1 Tax=Salisediminibacterium halotolerans TaxID=517425 RepID=A0A1H9WL28_9BACI|nr:trypsin-like peptidase domain-containing protein [Salisediminibacterium haloalkalitolerans]SES34544.1 serine protease Do [Salisediminibacterium haloalkalitolerans]
MGYYDQHTNEGKKRSEKSNRSGIYGLIGAVIGALIVVFTIPVLAGQGLLPYTIAPADSDPEQAEETEDDGDTPAESAEIEPASEVSEAVADVEDAVVGVVNMQIHEEGGFFMPEQESPNEEPEGTGSGVIYKIEGDRAYVVTNQHVIEGATVGSSDIEVTLNDGSRVEAEIVGEDVLTDLAVLTIDADGIDTTADFGDSDQLQTGEPAIAIGNPLAFEGSVTLGIISAVDRTIPIDLTGTGQTDWDAQVLQTDAAINPGNSGGALLNIHGEVIGINSMKIAQQAVEGIGFAIPTSVVLPTIEDLEEHGEVLRPQMGIVLRSMQEIPSAFWEEEFNLPDDVTGGVLVEDVEAGSPAEEGGLETGDVIVGLDDEEISDANDLRRYLYNESDVDDTLDVTFYRDGEEQTTDITLAREVFEEQP